MDHRTEHSLIRQRDLRFRLEIHFFEKFVVVVVVVVAVVVIKPESVEIAVAAVKTPVPVAIEAAVMPSPQKDH